MLRDLRQAGFAPKPLMTDPLERCHVLLDFVRHVEKEEPGLFICLDDADGILARIVAGHAKGAVVALLTSREGAASLPSPLGSGGRGFAVISPNTPEALLQWVCAAWKEHAREEEVHPSPTPVAAAEPVKSARPPRSRFTVEDLEWIEQLEQNFRPRLREAPRSVVEIPRGKALDFSWELRQVISRARDLAATLESQWVTPLHYLAALVELPQCDAYRLLRELGVDSEQVRASVDNHLPRGETPAAATFSPSPEATELVTLAKQAARERKRACLSTVDWLEGMLRQGGSKAAQILAEHGLSAETLEQRLAQGFEVKEETHEREHPIPPDAPVSVAIKPEQLADLQQRLSNSKAKPGPRELSSESTGSASPQSEAGNSNREVPEISPPKESRAENTAHESSTPARKTPLLFRCDALNPPLEVIEEAADTLLEGKVVAFPTETFYALAVDATSPGAVERLFALCQRARQHPLGVMIHSTMQLRHMVREIPPGVEDIMERFWPGPLTLVFRRHRHALATLAPDETIGVRMPDHYVALAILSMVGRPLAATTARIGEETSLCDAADVRTHFAEVVDLIIDCGTIESRGRSTVLSVVESPYRILRGGAISRQEIEEAAGRPVIG